MSEEAELKKLIQEVRRHFLAARSSDDSDLFATLDQLVDDLDTKYQELGLNFRHNLSTALSSLRMPYTLASAGTQVRHFQRIHMAESIRAIPTPVDEPEFDKLDEDTEKEVLQKAKLEMEQFLDSKEGRNGLRRDVCGFLLNILEIPDLKFAASELLRQGIILIWSAFEILCCDTFEQELNLNPSKTGLLVANVSTRKRFEVEKLPLDNLVQHGFDLSDKMGTVLVNQQDFSDLPNVKSIYSVLFSSPDLMKCLNHPKLWQLSQRRHLCVHRRGIVDQTYLANTGDDLPLGSTLKITPKVLEEYFDAVLETGESLLRCLPTKTVP